MAKHLIIVIPVSDIVADGIADDQASGEGFDWYDHISDHHRDNGLVGHMIASNADEVLFLYNATKDIKGSF